MEPDDLEADDREPEDFEPDDLAPDALERDDDREAPEDDDLAAVREPPDLAEDDLVPDDLLVERVAPDLEVLEDDFFEPPAGLLLLAADDDLRADDFDALDLELPLAEEARDLVLSSRTPTRRPSSETWLRTCSSVSTRRASRICCTVWTISSSSPCARLPVPATPPAAPAKVRSTASRRASAAPAFDFFACLSFSVFLAMGGKHTPIHLRPHAPVAERVILVGDPGRALRLAQELIDGPKMLNHHRGLWGYSGRARADAGALTVQSTGMGGPSAAAIVDDLVGLGMRRAVRVGTCRSDAGSRPGDVVVATAVEGADGTSRALRAVAAAAATRRAPGAVTRAAVGDASGLLIPDAGLTARVRAAIPGARAGLVASVDVFEDSPSPSRLARDHQSAAVLAAAAHHGFAAAVVLVVAATASDGHRIADDALHQAEARLGAAAVAALG